MNLNSNNESEDDAVISRAMTSNMKDYPDNAPNDFNFETPEQLRVQINDEPTAIGGMDETSNEEGFNLTELVVLDPDHPLMTRFQVALTEMLSKQLTRIELEDREVAEELRKNRTEHVEMGTELFTVQRELAQFQSQLGQLYDDYEEAKVQRAKIDNDLKNVRQEQKEVHASYQLEYVKMQELRQEMDNLALRLYYLRCAETDIEGDIAVMKRAAEKAVEDLYRVEKEKMHQDYLLDALVTEVDKIKDDISLYEAQVIAQDEEKCSALQTLHEAETEIEKIVLERKTLINKWNSSLHDLTRRNEALHVLNETLNEKKEQILTIENELEGYRRTTRNEEDLNERVTIILKKSELDLTNLQKDIGAATAKNNHQKDLYALNIRILQQSETQLLLINKEKQAEMAISEIFYQHLSMLTKMKYELEDKIQQELRNKLTMDSAKIVTEKMKQRTRDQTRQLESQVVKLDNLLSKNSLTIAELRTDITEIGKYLNVMNTEIDSKNDIINKLEIEINHSKTVIERKQDVIDKLNKNYDLLLKSRGGVELGPLEITIAHLNKSIALTTEDISNEEQRWLREQHDIVKLVTLKAELQDNINRLKQQIVLLTQKKIRIVGYIDIEDRLKSDLEHELCETQSKMVKVNKLIDRERYSEHGMELNQGFAETDFTRELQEEEICCAQLQSHIEDTERDKDAILRETMEVQWQVMMYEKKMQMLFEARSTLKSDLGLGEIKSMRADIHKMEVRFRQLKQQQELLIQDMEKSVAKRDIITTRGEALENLSSKVTTKGSLEKKMIQIKRKIKDIKKSSSECEGKTVELRQDMEKYTDSLKDKGMEIEDLKKELNDVKVHCEEISERRYPLVMELQFKQQLNKYFNDIRDKKYVRNCKTTSAIEREKVRVRDRVQGLLLVVERLMQEFPQIQRTLRPSLGVIQRNIAEFDGL